MVRCFLKATLVVVAIGCLIQDVHAAGPPRRRSVIEYLFGGYGHGPFGKGDFIYNGQCTDNFQAKTRVRHSR